MIFYVDVIGILEMKSMTKILRIQFIVQKIVVVKLLLQLLSKYKLS